MEAKKLKEELFNKKQTAWKKVLALDTEAQAVKNTVFKFSDEYMYFLNRSKTEREVIEFAEKMLVDNGFININNVSSLTTGDKVYFVNRNKNIYAAVIGINKLEDGLNIIGSHADSPRLDLKPNPLYEDSGFAYAKTHYYGGIKKYQWTTIPLAIHGVVVKSNGEKVKINIGEDDSDPIFTITDLLPHLAHDQMNKKLSEGVNGENLSLLLGSMPYTQEEISENIKLNILSILYAKYGMKEVDFLSSELEVVPAFKARSSGFDCSLVAAYGQDDKVCAYTSIRALLDQKRPNRTAVCILADKEEIGSMGNTGMESEAFEFFVSELLNKANENKPDFMRKVFYNSKMLSADVDAGLDPLYASVSDKNNAAYLGRGVTVNKYTGARGKSGASDANAEFVGEIRNIFENAEVPYQVTELGKVDAGGGGTIAYILANKGIDVIDCGVPVLSMHAPYEVTSKLDVYSAYQAYKAFFEA